MLSPVGTSSAIGTRNNVSECSRNGLCSHRCLQNLRVPRTCPLCRAAFHLTRAVKVHVDIASEDSPLVLTRDEVEAQRLEGKLAETASCPSTVDPVVDIPPDCVEVIEEAQSWLEGIPSDQVGLITFSF